MTQSERTQHLLLMFSFFLLAVTGFMLSYPEAFWVRWLAGVFGSLTAALRGPIHRLAAVVLIGTSVYHIVYRLFTERGKQFKRDIRFRRKDCSDMAAVFRYNTGRSSERPQFGRFSYVEKVEYWSVVWGTALMTLTGVALWFESTFIGWFTKLFVDASGTIHLMEAWLALLAIIVWHLYAVVFDPDVAPMNVTWITGRKESRVESRES